MKYCIWVFASLAFLMMSACGPAEFSSANKAEDALGSVQQEGDPNIPKNDVTAEDPEPPLSDGTCANPKKKPICHVPPGNPANQHTLCLPDCAIKAHLREHDDYLGTCQ